jgi:hypothetical protein
MEDVLDLYAEPYQRAKPVVCFDEKSFQRLDEVRPPIVMKKGHPKRQDYEYKRQGTSNLFMFFQPLAGLRHVEVTERRTKVDFADCMKALVDDFFPWAEQIRVVLDNLNTHTAASLYERFPAEEARRLAKKIEFHYTPKHGSWLNMAEIEIGVLANQCLDRRIPDMETLKVEVAAWENDRNNHKATVKWRFSTAAARIKLARLYPLQ